MIFIPENFYEIPFDGVSNDTVITTTLDGVEFNLRFMWSNRYQQWNFYVYDINNVLVYGPKVIKS